MRTASNHEIAFEDLGRVGRSLNCTIGQRRLQLTLGRHSKVVYRWDDHQILLLVNEDQLLDFGRAFRGLKVESLVLVNEERQLWLWKRIVESYYQVNEDWLAESKKGLED